MIMSTMYRIQPSLTIIFFTLSPVSHAGGHEYKLCKPYSTGIRSNFFCVRVINVWNNLPAEVNFSTINTFSRSIVFFDVIPCSFMLRYLILCTILCYSILRLYCYHPVSVCYGSRKCFIALTCPLTPLLSLQCFCCIVSSTNKRDDDDDNDDVCRITACFALRHLYTRKHVRWCVRRTRWRV